MLFKSEVKEDRVFKYFIHLSNESQYEKTYALTAFVNAKQVEIQRSKVIFVKVASKERIVIPSSIKIEKLKDKIHELNVIAVGSPGLSLDDKKTQELPGYDEEIYASNRAALIEQ